MLCCREQGRSVLRRSRIRREEVVPTGTDLAAMSEDALIVAIAKYPIIVERPIVSNSKATLGRSYSIKAGSVLAALLPASTR
jgi:arsenate reductase-like glutaredoxin family protein